MPDSPAEILLFELTPHPLSGPLLDKFNAQPGVNCTKGQLNTRSFPDGESYLRIDCDVNNKDCIVLGDLAHPNHKYLPLIFLAETLREFGACSVGLVAPYLSYMRQDRRFLDGEALTSKIFAQSLSRHVDWLVTVDPHLHRYHSLQEIYSIPTQVVQGAPVLAGWLAAQKNIFLVGPDSESEQWVSAIAERGRHPYVIGTKQRFGDRDVKVTIADVAMHKDKTAVIVDDVISSGQTILQCIAALRAQGIKSIQCAAVHGLFAVGVYDQLLKAGLTSLITCNTIPHESNAVDVSAILCEAILRCLNK